MFGYKSFSKVLNLSRHDRDDHDWQMSARLFKKLHFMGFWDALCAASIIAGFPLLLLSSVVKVSGDGERRPHGHHEGEVFNFTRGRFVSNEDHEMSQRYVRFNVHELARVAAEAVGSKACEKYPDGMYNKAFLMTMDDGTEIVAKIPNPNAGRSHFATASEVATMEFVNFAKSSQKTLY